MFEEGQIGSENPNEMQNFADKYAIDNVTLVKNELQHMELIKFKRGKRSEMRRLKTQTEKDKPIEEYDWFEIHTNGKIKDLSVNLLSMYIFEKKLCNPIPRKKVDKVALVEAHISRQKAINSCKSSSSAGHEEDETVSDVDDDVISDVSEEEITLRQIESDSEGSDQEMAGPPVAIVNRFGRRTSNWKQRKFFGDSDSDSD